MMEFPVIRARVKWWTFWYWLKRWWMVLALFGGLAAMLGIWIAASPSPVALSLKIHGRCVAAPLGGVLYATGRGFKPYEQYSMEIYRDGKLYGSFYGSTSGHSVAHEGSADAFGNLSYWQWPCANRYYDPLEVTPSGKYTVVLRTRDTNKTARAEFMVLPASSLK